LEGTLGESLGGGADLVRWLKWEVRHFLKRTGRCGDLCFDAKRRVTNGMRSHEIIDDGSRTRGKGKVRTAWARWEITEPPLAIRKKKVGRPGLVVTMKRGSGRRRRNAMT